ncbi:DUF4442 domain-containing protein [Flavisolibacter ginsenosidimutans]|uniref:DUF4442 domain-containing protein n=1 Tax=Flavisolibacter ginsenosidimutans TaxID=661481 RepID=A0A5B8UPT1_9BACT|nr:DUF4442 domain-containing protein [Flavisolibacter ginsenosidimutans]QEC58249.1 DUF4442 domain-containing protein [Flavisolibacter ginsenosidimutans]
MEKTNEKAAAENTAAFFSLINHPVKFRLYLLKKLPAGYFSGLKIVKADVASCTVSIPFKWFTKNPFRSTYFACLSMAAEMSTGVLAMAQVRGRKPAVSMLVTGIEGKFYKKATGLTFFQCEDGEAIRNVIGAAVSSGTPQEIKAHSIGKNDRGEVVAEFWITWSFKAKPQMTQI